MEVGQPREGQRRGDSRRKGGGGGHNQRRDGRMKDGWLKDG